MHPLAQLYMSQIAIAPQLAAIEEHVLDERLPRSLQMTDVQLVYDYEKAKLYFRLYTVPILEYAGLLMPNRKDEAIRWGKCQFLMGMHIRYIDKVIDADILTNHYHEVQISYYYLLAAIAALNQYGYSWTSSAQAIYSQFLQYEAEIRAGYRHSYGSIWRRVSPLSVVPSVYLSTCGCELSLDKWYREYLSWSLLRADCDDVFKDVNNGTITPIAKLVQEVWTDSYHDAMVAHDVVMKMMQFLEHKQQLLSTIIQPRYPLWSICVSHLQQSHGDTVRVL